MIKRIVKLHFDPEQVETFQALFEATKGQIRAFPGCEHLELLQDIHQPHLFFTLSYWSEEAALEQYRQSELFRATWEKTKALFAGRPEAWSVQVASTTPS